MGSVLVDVWLLGLLLATVLVATLVAVAHARDWPARRCLAGGAAVGFLVLGVMFVVAGRLALVPPY